MAWVRRNTLERIESDLRDEIEELKAELVKSGETARTLEKERDAARAAYRGLLTDLGAFCWGRRELYSWASTQHTIPTQE